MESITRTIWANVAMEMVGTGILLAIISLAMTTLKENAPLAIVPLLVGLIYMGFELSGAHYNPAVTLTFYMRNRFSPELATRYVLGQFSGGFCGALFATLISGKAPFMKISPGYTIVNALFAELLFTTILCFSILTITLRSNSELHPLFGTQFLYFWHLPISVAIAGVVLSGALLAGPISGGAFNPVVILVLSIMNGFSNFRYAILTSIVHLIAAVVAASLFYFVAPEELQFSRRKKVIDTDIEHGIIVNDYTPLLA